MPESAPPAIEPCSVGLFVDTAARLHEARPALQDGHQRFTAAEVARWVRAFAVAARAVGAPGDRIALLANRDAFTLLALIGIAAAGRVVVPVDPREPDDRVSTILASARSVACIRVTDSGSDAWASFAADLADADVPFPDVAPDFPALLLFTSGSTGTPKGVLRTHAMLTGQGALQAWQQILFPGLRFANAYPLSFLGGVLGLLATLDAGAENCLVDPSVVGPGPMANELASRHLGGFSAVPSLVRAVADHALRNRVDLTHVLRVTFGGEPVTGAELARVRAALPRARLLGFYGTQEAGSVAWWEATHDTDEGLVPAGRPLPDCRVFVLDDTGASCPPGAFGDVVVAGPYVALEYWDDPAESAASQVMVDGVVALRTGDVGRWRADGVLEIGGRADQRVKVRGQGVDLLEVEAALARLPGVAAAVVSPVPDARSGTRLVAHVEPVPDADLDTAVLRRGLRERLPRYMVPGTIRVVDAMPVTAREKVDRAALARAAAAVNASSAPATAPGTALEAELRTMTADVLAVAPDDVGFADDFYGLGGDSLRALELLDAIFERYQLESADRAVLEQAMAGEPSVAAIAHALSLRLERPVVTNGGAAVVRVGGPSASGSQRCFFVGGIGTRPVALRSFAERLECTELFTFMARGMNDRRWPDRTATTLARRQVSLLRAVQPDGPYVVAGYSFGGLLALEMARALREAGEAVPLVVAVDTALHQSLPAKPLRRAAAVARADVRAVLAEFVGAYSRSPVRRRAALRAVAGRIIRHRRFAPYDGSVLLLLSEERCAAGSDVGWRDVVTGHLEIVEVPGPHLEMLQPPHVEVIARVFESAINEALHELGP
jgi:acyl-CoA synthetase (AMP-forming)/AMP-acid ligase II/thioesterase domain-containing protein/acyl carrier protein